MAKPKTPNVMNPKLPTKSDGAAMPKGTTPAPGAKITKGVGKTGAKRGKRGV